MNKIEPNMDANQLMRVNVSKKNVVEALIEDPNGALAENIMTVLEQRLEKLEPNLAYFEVDYDPRQETMTAFCEVFDEAYTDIVVINLWYYTIDSHYEAED